MQKSGNVKLRIINRAQWGQTVILPTVGETEIGKDGIFEIEDTVATILLRNTSHYKLVEGNGTTVTAAIHPDDLDEENTEVVEETEEESSEDETAGEGAEEESEEEEGEEEESEEENSEEEEESDEDDGLDDKNLGELIEIAEKAEIPAEDYKKFKKSKKLMVNFLRKYAAE